MVLPTWAWVAMIVAPGALLVYVAEAAAAIVAAEEEHRCRRDTSFAIDVPWTGS